MRQEDRQFKANLGHTAGPCPERGKKKEEEEEEGGREMGRREKEEKGEREKGGDRKGLLVAKF